MLELLYATLFLGLIPAIITLLKKVNVGPIAPFIYLTAISVGYEIVFSLILKKNSTVWFAVYESLEFISIIYYFYKLNYPTYRWISNIFIALLLISQTVQYCLLGENFLSQPLSSFVYNLYIFIFSALWFLRTFSKMEAPNLWSIPDFYYISGILIYHSSTFFLFLLSDVIMKFDAETFLDYWVLNIVATLLLRIFLITGIWKTSLK